MLKPVLAIFENTRKEPTKNDMVKIDFLFGWNSKFIFRSCTANGGIELRRGKSYKRSMLKKYVKIKYLQKSHQSRLQAQMTGYIVQLRSHMMNVLKIRII